VGASSHATGDRDQENGHHEFTLKERTTTTSIRVPFGEKKPDVAATTSLFV